jgi:hypothetical protein
VGHTILPSVYRLRNDLLRVYHEPGSHDSDERHRQAIARHLIRRLQHLGNTVVLQPVGAP